MQPPGWPHPLGGEGAGGLGDPGRVRLTPLHPALGFCKKKRAADVGCPPGRGPFPLPQ